MKKNSDGFPGIFFRTDGSGPPLIFLHDWNSSSAPFRKVNLPLFRTRFHVAVVDLPGFGKSPLPGSLSLESLCQSILDVADSLGWKKFHLMGFCLGGILAMDLAIRHPHRVDRLILLEPQFTFPVPLKLLVTPALGSFLLGIFSKWKPGLELVLRVLGGNMGMTAQLLKQAVASARRSSSLAYLKMLAEYGRENHWTRISGYTGLCLTVVGERSWSGFRKSASRASELMHHGSLAVIPGAKHFLLLERPKEIFSLIARFMESTPVPFEPENSGPRFGGLRTPDLLPQEGPGPAGSPSQVYPPTSGG